MSFSEKDISLMREKGIDPEKVEQQIAIFKRGNIVVDIREAATIKNGIRQLSEEEKAFFTEHYESKKDQLNILKFVPASGAATRMFKAFYNLLKKFHPEKQGLEDYVDQQNDPKLEMFFSRMKCLPFYEEVMDVITKKYSDFDHYTQDKQQYLFVKAMLEEEGLNLGNQPKGLVPFHRYEDHLATAFEEHFAEALDYAVAQEVVKIHFTIAKEHREKFEAEGAAVKKRLSQTSHVEFLIGFSYQDPKTDTLAVTLDNKPFRDENGNLFFRPGGHGALLENLQEQEADIIFIKNIDNVVTPRHRQVLAKNKKALAGLLISLQEQTFQYLKKLDGPVDETELEAIKDFLQNELNAGHSLEFSTLSPEEKVFELRRRLNRPLRVCGMVKNEGEPGGGPFWVNHRNGEISLQIVESSQIDHDNYQQSKIAQEATHFNPVDIVCSFRDYKGNKFNLEEFVDKDTSFIATKTKGGKEIRALELPGLWNGGMARWNSVFVEVPAETFNPVKTISDLLKSTHQTK